MNLDTVCAYGRDNGFKFILAQCLLWWVTKYLPSRLIFDIYNDQRIIKFNVILLMNYHNLTNLYKTHYERYICIIHSADCVSIYGSPKQHAAKEAWF